MLKTYKNYKISTSVAEEFDAIKKKCRCSVEELIEALIYLTPIDAIKKYLYNKGE